MDYQSRTAASCGEWEASVTAPPDAAVTLPPGVYYLDDALGTAIEAELEAAFTVGSFTVSWDATTGKATVRGE